MAPGTAVAVEQTESEEAWVASLVKLGLTKIEIDREKKMKKNREVMAQCGLLDAADAVQKSMDQAKAQKGPKPKAAKRWTVPREDDPNVRKSARLEGKDAPDYKDDPEDTLLDGKSSSPKGCSRGGPRVPVTMGQLPDVKMVELLLRDPAKAWQNPRRGWKKCFGTPSHAAACAAGNAAEAFAEKLTAEHRPTYVKFMTTSQVKGGFWSSVPRELGILYGSRKHRVKMLSDDQAHRAPDSFMRMRGKGPRTNSVCWDIVYVPRKGDAGWSGSWVHFAVDHMLGPCDAVVFEVLDNEEGEAWLNEQLALHPGRTQAAAAAAAATAAAEAADGAAAAAEGADGGAAAAAEAVGSSGAADAAGSSGAAAAAEAADGAAAAAGSSGAAAAAAAAAAAGSSGAAAAEAADGGDDATGVGDRDQDAAAAVPLAGGAEEVVPGSSTWVQQASRAKRQAVLDRKKAAGQAAAGASDGVACAAAAVGARGGKRGAAAGAAVAKRSAVNHERNYVRAYIFRASAYETEEEQQRRQQQLVAAAAKAAAAKAAEGDGEPAAQPAAAGADGVDAADAAAGTDAADADADAGDAGVCVRRQATAAGSSKQQQSDQAAAAVTQKKRSRVQDPQLEELQQEDTTRQKKPKTAAAAAGTAAAAAAGSKGSKRKRPAAAAAGGGAGAKKSKAAAAGLVPQPANKSVLVPPPTAEEIALNESAEEFEVEQIMGHKVVRGEDKFLIRWAGFGPYWDSWEGVGCLNQPPRAYSWQGGQQAIPAKFRK